MVGLAAEAAQRSRRIKKRALEARIQQGKELGHTKPLREWDVESVALWFQFTEDVEELMALNGQARTDIADKFKVCLTHTLDA